MSGPKRRGLAPSGSRRDPHARSFGRGRGDPADRAWRIMRTSWRWKRLPRAPSSSLRGAATARSTRWGARWCNVGDARRPPVRPSGSFPADPATGSPASWAFRSTLHRRSSAACARQVRRRRCRGTRRPGVLQCGGHRARRACRGSRLHAHAPSRAAAVLEGERRRSPALPACRLHDRHRRRTTQTSALVLALANSKQWGFGAQIAPGRISRTACSILSSLKIADSSGTCCACRRCSRGASIGARYRYASRAGGHDSVARGDAVSCRRGSGAGLGHAHRARASGGAAAAGVNV